MKTMRRSFLVGLIALVFGAVVLLPATSLAAGISPSSGGSHAVGQSFTVNIVASGATFNAFQGLIKVTGPASASVSPGSASWAPGGTPSANGSFAGGITSPASSFTIAKLTLKGTSVGSGSVTVSGVELVNNGSVVGSGGGSVSFTITRAPTPPGSVTVTSSTNPDPTQSYGVSTVELAWTAPANGATGYSVVFDQVATTTPPQTVTTTALAGSYPITTLGTYYFHILANNADGWGPVTHFQLNVSHSVDTGLKAPKITGVSKLPAFKNNITLGTVSGFKIFGSSSGLTGYIITLVLTPAAGIPAAQLLTSPIAADGSWMVTFDQQIPSGFYKVVATATKDKVATAASPAVNIELSVANGGTVKIITNGDLPQPNLTVRVLGIIFSDKSHLGWAIAAVIIFAGLVTGLAYGARQLYKYQKNKKNRVSSPAKPEGPRKINL